MDIRALRYFVEVIQRQSYTDAARALFVTQPTVSKMIRQLEDELGTPVLLKEGRRLQPTDTGRVVLRRGAEILALHTQLRAELADLKRTARGELVMGVPPLANELLTPLLKRYHQEYPNIELRLFERGSRTVEEELRAGTLEIGAMMLPADPAGYESLPICNYPLQLMAPLDSIWAARQSVRLEELAAESFVFYGEGFVLNETVHDACLRAGFTPTVAGRTSQWDFMASMVAAGVGVALLPALFTRRLAGRCAVIALEDPQIWWHMGLVWRRGRYLSQAARAWLEMARTMLPVESA